MPAASASSSSRRLLALLSLLQTRRDWPSSVLAERLEVSERTVRRDVDRLRELDYVIDATRGRDGGYRLGAGATLPPLLFDDDQAVALALTLQTASLASAGLEEAASRARATLDQLLPSRLAHRVAELAITAVAPAGPTVDPALLLLIGRAIARRQELRFHYAAPNPSGAVDAAGVGGTGSGAAASGAVGAAGVGPGAASRVPAALPRHVEPHHLLLRGGRWYLLAWSPDAADWRTFRVDRIEPLTHLGRAFAPREVPGGDPVAYLEARFKGRAAAGEPVVNEWLCRGSAVLDAPASAVAPYLADGTVEPLGPDRCRVTRGSWSWRGLAAEFLRTDADLSEVAPAALREALAALARRAAAASRP